MSSIRVNIDRVVLNGFEAAEGKTLIEGLRSQLLEALADRANRKGWLVSHDTPALKYCAMPMHSGSAGARVLGERIGQRVAGGLKA